MLKGNNGVVKITECEDTTPTSEALIVDGIPRNLNVDH